MNIVLKSVGVNKVKVIKVLCEVASLELKEAKEIVDRVEGGNEYTITDIQETDVQAIIEKFTKIGAVVEVENAVNDESDGSSKESDKEGKTEKAFNKLIDKFAEFLGWFLEWHEKSLKKNKVLTIALIIAEVAVVLFILIKNWEIILGILFVIALAAPFIFKKDYTDEDRNEIKKMGSEFATSIIKIVALCIILLVIVFVWNNVLRPGAVVRNSYFPSYSDEITIGDAFENVFTNCKWSKYKYNGNQYVRFTGDFKLDDGAVSTYQINFLVLGDACSIDSIYIDGLDVSGMETIILVGIYNRNGVSW